MPKCNYEYKPKVPNVLEDIPPEIPLDCKVPTENGKFCIFHDKDYYVKSAKQAITPKYEVAKRFEDKVKESIDQNKPLICFGYYLPGINFAELLGKSIAQPVYFSQATFSKESNFRGATFTERADFVRAKFTEGAWFGRATFSKDADFRGVKFLDEVYFLHDKFKEKILFRYTLFEQQNKVTFGDNDLSKVSFAGSDVTRIRFGDGITWGGKDKITIIEEEWLRERAEGQTKTEVENVKLELVLSVYRNLREL